MPDLYEGATPLMEAAHIGSGGFNGGADEGAEPKFLKLLLKYGGDPNSEEKGPRNHGNKVRYTPLVLACEEGNLDYVKILVNAGANINYINEYGQNPLGSAVIASESPDIVLYLIEKGADFKRPILKTVDGESEYITDGLRYWRFDIGSVEYKKKMQIVDFLKKQGMDYRKTEIPKEYLEDYPKEYLEKY
jgi:hypothetical protein